MKRRALVAWAVVAAVAGAMALGARLAGVGEAPGAVPGTLLRPDDGRVLAVGRRVYAAHCATCHGSRLEGQPGWQRRGADGLLPAPPHDASGHTWHHPDAVLFRITKLGVAAAAGMPGYATAMPVYDGVLGDDEIVAVLSWIKSQWPAGIRAKHDQLNRQAALAP